MSSEARYEHDGGEPDTREVAETAFMPQSEPLFECAVDESAGFRG